jgi:hypothetical protein
LHRAFKRIISDKDRFFGSAIAVLDATIKAIAAAIMQSSFFISPRPFVPRLKISHRLFAARCVALIYHHAGSESPDTA